MERNFDNFKGKVVEDTKGNLYFVNGFVSDKMIVYTSLNDKSKVFAVPASYFLNMDSFTKNYRFFLNDKIVPPTDLPILTENQTLKTFIPVPHKWVIITLVLMILFFIAANIILLLYF